MYHLQQTFSVTFHYDVYFTSGLFNPSNQLFADCLRTWNQNDYSKKIFFVVDNGVLHANPSLLANIRYYFKLHPVVQLIDEIAVIPGGETAKNNESYFGQILTAVNTHKIDRHSYIAAIGGGAVLDMVGYAAAVAHRGIKHIRIPTTVLSQNDSGIGVKNSINYFNKKNFLGTFVPPFAVFNDDLFLKTLSQRNWRSGISEAIKVALIKDSSFFEWMEKNITAITNRDATAMNFLIRECAKLHLQHIAGKDPFESGSSRPLDFGHWSAHKIEQLSNYEILHGEAVAMGIALDTVYSNVSGRLSLMECERIIRLLKIAGFELTHPLMEIKDNDSPLLNGLQEFREHLGGQLTIMLLTSIGSGIEVHEVNPELLKQASIIVKKYQEDNTL